MAKKKTAKSNILADIRLIPVNLFAHSLWDEDFGTMVTVKGIKELLKEIMTATTEEGWLFQDIEVSEADDSLFFIKLNRPSLLKEKKKRGTCRT